MRSFYITTILLGSLCSFHASADIAIIVNPQNTADLDNNLIRSIFLSKTKHFPNGETIQTLALEDDTEEMKIFNREIIKKSQTQLNSYWSRMIFSSKGQPPAIKEKSQEIKKIVASNINAIGIVNANQVDDSVKVMLTIKQ